MSVSSVDDEIGGRMPVESMESLKDTSVSKIPIPTLSNDQKQLTNSEKKNASHSSNENVNVVPRKKAKLLRIERKQNKLLAQGKSQSEIESIMKERKQQNCVKSLEELFDEVYTGLKKLEVTMQYKQSISQTVAYLVCLSIRSILFLIRGPLFSNSHICSGQ